MNPPRYLLLDANVTAAYYMSQSTRSSHTRERVANIFDSVRSGESDFFLYLPNFCVAEVFSVFMKYSFGKWNNHVRSNGTIDTRVYSSLVKQFQSDIHNGKFIYHYELSRYHVLAINLVAPIDHYFQISRSRKKNKQVHPAGTFDHLIIAMGIHLARIHGPDDVAIVSSDTRLTNVLKKCKSPIPEETLRKLKLDKAGNLTGIPFIPESFPLSINLQSATKSALAGLFGKWPLPVGKMKKVYRHT